ncbi:MAG: hypothetical protein AAGI88_23765 [Pseudomonadota bacterium]
MNTRLVIPPDTEDVIAQLAPLPPCNAEMSEYDTFVRASIWGMDPLTFSEVFGPGFHQDLSFTIHLLRDRVRK